MSDLEFELIDELYFLSSFQDLSKKLGISDSELKELIKLVVQKGWVKCLDPLSEEDVTDSVDLYNRYKDFNYLVTKKGLFAHNSTHDE